MSLQHLIADALRLLHPGQKKKGAIIIILMIINAVLDFFSVAAFLPLMAAIITADFAHEQTWISHAYVSLGFTSHVNFIVTITSCVLAFLVLKNLIVLLISRIKVRYAFEIRNSVSSRAMTYCLEKSYLDFTKADFTRELHSITSHPLSFANNIILSLTTILSEAVVGILILGYMVYFDYRVFILVALVLTPVFAIFRLRKNMMKKISNELKSTYPALLKRSNQAIEGFVEIKAYQKTNFFFERFQEISIKIAQTFIKDQTMQAGTLRLTEILVSIVMCSLIIYSVIAKLAYPNTLMLLGIYTLASFRTVPSANRILHCLQQIHTNKHVIAELNLFNKKIPPAKIAPQEIGASEKIDFKEKIEIVNLSFTYPDRAQGLDQISMTIRKGQKVAITGKSGEGKTTLLLILLGFLKQTEGLVLVDGKPISEKGNWLELFSYVAQNPYIIDGSVADNIAFGVRTENIDRKRIRELMHSVQLDDLLNTMPDGIDSRIGERGAEISGGQRQRVAIARALYRNAEIFVFDEVTNQLHGMLEAEILELLNLLSRSGKTIILVTHKIANPKFFDVIFKLENGRLHPITAHSQPN
jgi:ATP-binding cassette, subfamily B, bacterial PglK